MFIELIKSGVGGKMKIGKYKLFVSNEGKYRNFILITLFSIIYFIGTLFFAYGDQIYNTIHSILFLDGMVHGRIFDTYQYYIDLINSGNDKIVFVPVYSPVCLLILGVINLPSFVLYELGVIDLSSRVIIIYEKIQLLLVILGCVLFINKIIRMIVKEESLSTAKKNEASFFFLSTTGVVFYALMLGQLEIFSVLFSLIGIYYYLKDSFKKFILFFSIATVFKMYALIIFIPLVLIRKKKLLSIIIAVMGGMGFSIVGDLLWNTIDKTYSIVKYESGLRMINSMVSTDWCGFSVFVIAYSLICFFVYVSERKDNTWPIFISFLTFSVMYLLVDWAPYYIVCFTPFFPLLLVNMDENRKQLSQIMCSVFDITYVLYGVMAKYYFMITPYIYKNLIIPNESTRAFKYGTVAEMVNDFHNIEPYYPIIKALWAVSLIVMVILASPLKITLPRLFEKLHTTKIIFIRLLFIIILISSIIYVYIKKPDDIIYENTAYGVSDNIINVTDAQYVINGDDAISQHIKFENDIELKKLLLLFDREHMDYCVYQSVYVEIVDCKTNSVVASNRMGVNQLNQGTYTTFKFDDVELKANTEYSFNIFSDSPSTYSYLYVKTTEKDVENSNLEIMGSEINTDLSMIIYGNVE